MNRICAVVSWFLGSLGVALLVISILLVPQSRVLADPAPAVCGGPNACNLVLCGIQYPTCPGTCTVGGVEKYCKCVSDPTNCPDCVCKKNPAIEACDCLLP